jgi:glycosyltransferase involved in cell wall biosynthesis
MKVLLLNTFDNLAGADRAARRLCTGLRRIGVEARLLVHFRLSAEGDVLCFTSPWRTLLRRLKLYLGTLPVRICPRRPERNFTPALLPDRLPERAAGLAPDLIHLHWLGAGFCRIESLARFTAPLIWTLHDSWPFTGGCHVPGSCERYRERCGACPVLGSSRDRDLSRWTWRRKERAWRDLPLTLVAPSRWMADRARASSLFRERRIEVIPNGIDTEIFRPMDKGAARRQLGLPPERPVILFGAVNALDDPNKGWALLRPALEFVAKDRPEALAVVFGGLAPTEPLPGLETIFLGRLEDDAALVASYAAADVFVAPSLQESFCQTLLEAMACGTPTVAFRATGPLDLIEHGRSGYLAEPYEVADLANGLLWVLEDEGRRAALSGRARAKAVDEFALEAVASRYAQLYRELLEVPAVGENP